jgi:hypothetical protein
MHASHDDCPRSRGEQRGPSMYYGYCGRERRYRMMDLPDFMSNMQEGMSRMMSAPLAAYQDVMSRCAARLAARTTTTIDIITTGTAAGAGATMTRASATASAASATRMSSCTRDAARSGAFRSPSAMIRGGNVR